jgi:hypothetical protein
MVVTQTSGPWMVTDDPKSVSTNLPAGIVLKVVGSGAWEDKGLVNVEVPASTADALWSSPTAVRGFVLASTLSKGSA